jgi:hypothetical protein
VDLQNGSTIEYNFDGISSGQYSFTYDVVDSTAETIDSINVRELEDNNPSFTQQSYTGIYTGTTDIVIDMPSGVESSEVEISDKTGSYVATVEIQNRTPSIGSEVTLSINTLLAGNNYQGSTFSLSVNNSEDSESEDSEGGSSSGDSSNEEPEEADIEITQVTESTTPTDAPLDPTNYLLTLRSEGEETDLAGLTLREMDLSSETYIVPQTVTLEDLRTEEVEQELDNGETITVTREIEEPFYTKDIISEGSTIADSDRVYLVFENTGIEQFINSDEFGGSIESLDSGDFNENSELAEQLGIYLTVTAENPRPNEADIELDVTELDYISSEEKNFIAFGFDPNAVDDLDSEIGTYTAELTVDERNPAVREEPIPGTDIPVTEPLTETQEITIEETNTQFEHNTVFVEPQQELEVQGTTNLAQNTELTLVARNDDLSFPYLEQQEVTIPAEGEFSGSFELGEPEVGEDFRIFFSEIGRTGPHTTVEVVEDAEAAREERDSTGEEEEEDSEDDEEEVATQDVTVELLDSQTGQRVQGFVSFEEQSASTSGDTLTVPTEQEVELTTRTQDAHVDRTVTEFIEPDQDTVSIELDPSNPAFTAGVSVENESGEPVEGASIEVAEQTTNPEVLTGTTGLNGSYQFTTTETSYTITVSAEGYETTEKTTLFTQSESTTTVVLAEEEPEVDNTDDEEAPGQPGFGPLSVIVALIALVISVYRDDNSNV